jgi:hypothetical protein
MKLTQGTVKLFQGLLILAAFILIVWLVHEGADRMGLNAVGYCEQKYWGDPKRIKECEDQQIEASKNRSPEEKARHERVRDLLK